MGLVIEDGKVKFERMNSVPVFANLEIMDELSKYLDLLSLKAMFLKIKGHPEIGKEYNSYLKTKTLV